VATYNSSGGPAPSGNDVAGSAFFKKFLASAEQYIQQPSRLKDVLVKAFNKARENKEVGTLAHDAWETIQSLVRLVRLSVAGKYTGLPTTTIIAAVAVLVYFVSPIDLIPDFIPVIGYLDDMALIAWFSTSIKKELDKFHEWEAAKAATLADPHQFAAAASATNTSGGAYANQLVLSQESAKNAGTVNLPSAPAGTGQSATDDV